MSVPMFGWKADGFTSTTLHRDYAPVGRVYRSGKGWTADVDGIPGSPTFPILAEAQRWVEDRCPLPLCPACIGSIGGARGGPDAPHRPASKGEPCGAADCQGAPWPGDDDEGPDDPALDIEAGDGRTMRERLGLGGGE